MKTALVLLLAEGVFGAFDTLYFHEWKARLPATPTACLELRLHAARDFVYAALFGSLGWMTWYGTWAWLLLILLAVEIGITLWDFVEEDQSRALPPGERMTHAVMGIVYGAFLAFLVPEVMRWMRHPTSLVKNEAGTIAWLLSIMAGGVFCSGVRDLWASATTASPNRLRAALRAAAEQHAR